MRISQYIQAKKEQFLDKRTDRKKTILQQEAKRLEREKNRQVELAKISKKNLELQKSIDQNKKINDKYYSQKKSVVKTLGKALKQVGKETRSFADTRKKSANKMFGESKGADFSTKGVDTSSRGIEFSSSKKKKEIRYF